MLFGKERQFFVIKHHMRLILRGLRCNSILLSICSLLSASGFLLITEHSARDKHQNGISSRTDCI